jgi:hypothetical protein
MTSLAIAVSVLVALGVASFSQESHHPIPAGDIRRAIAWGREGTPAPYPLLSAFDNATSTAAVVFTPAVRIALNAQRAHHAGEPYDVAQVVSTNASTLLHIVMSASFVAPKGGLVTEKDPVRMVIVKDRNAYESPLAQSAVWVRHHREGREPLVAAGESEHGIVVGAFSRQQLCSDCYVMVFRVRRDPPEGGLGSQKQAIVSGAKLGRDLARFY